MKMNKICQSAWNFLNLLYLLKLHNYGGNAEDDQWCDVFGNNFDDPVHCGYSEDFEDWTRTLYKSARNNLITGF